MRRLVSLSNYLNLNEIRNCGKSDDSFQISDSDREEIIVMIVEFCWNDFQILEMLPHISRGTITAFRAHITRGTYD